MLGADYMVIVMPSPTQGMVEDDVRITGLFLAFALLAVTFSPAEAQTTAQTTTPARTPMPVGVAGLTHDHAYGLFNALKRGDITVVGIAEPNRALAQRYADKYGFSMDIVYDDLATMLDKTHPVAVLGFGDIASHRQVVEAAAPRGIHVMVEKPLAVDPQDARAMAALAHQYHIQLLTNYETTWYATTAQAGAMVADGSQTGPIRRMVFHDGHEGPVKIGVSADFLNWLTDPVKNGGGAIVDFGCYGANLMTWLTQGQRPVSVTAITRHFQPDVYPRVDDDATIIVDYPAAQGIAEASWDWPGGRKDMEIYGVKGQIIAEDRHRMLVRGMTADSEHEIDLDERTAPYDDPFAYFRAVIEGQVKPGPYDPSSLDNNLLVVEILDAAKRSAQTGQTVKLPAE